MGSFSLVWATQALGLANVVSRRTFLRNVRSDHRHIVRPRCRLDVCTKCNVRDRSISGTVLKDSRGWLRILAERGAGLGVAPPTADPSATSEYIHAMLAYLVSLAAAASELSAMGAFPGLQHLALHDAIAAIRHSISTQWRASVGRLGLSELVNCFEGHFGLRDAFKAYHDRSWHEPRRGVLYMHIDFAEHHSLPIGPVVTGEAFYANSLLGITVFGSLLWHADARSHRFYLSEVKEQTALFAQSCVEDHLWSAGARRSVFNELVLFVDSGPHFLAAQFLAFS